MIITNNSHLMNCQTVEMFTRAYQSVCEGRSVDKTVLKPLLDLTKDVYGKGFSKNMESADDRYHAGFYLKDLPESLPNGDCRNKAKCLYELFIYNHYSIDPRKVVGFVDEYFEDLDTFNKLGYKTKINTHTTSCINLFLDIYFYSEYRLIYC